MPAHEIQAAFTFSNQVKDLWLFFWNYRMEEWLILLIFKPNELLACTWNDLAVTVQRNKFHIIVLLM